METWQVYEHTIQSHKTVCFKFAIIIDYTALKIFMYKILNFINWTLYIMYLMAQFSYYDQWLLGLKGHVKVVCFTFFSHRLHVYLSCLKRFLVMDCRTPEMLLRKCLSVSKLSANVGLGLQAASASSLLAGTSCHSSSVSCSARGRRLSSGSISLNDTAAFDLFFTSA